MTKQGKLILIRLFYRGCVRILIRQKIIKRSKVMNEDGFYAHFLAWAATRPDLQDCPNSKETLMQLFYECFPSKKISAEDVVRAWMGVFRVCSDADKFVPNEKIYAYFSEWLQKKYAGYSISRNHFGRILRTLMPSLPSVGMRKFDRHTRKQTWGLPLQIVEVSDEKK